MTDGSDRRVARRFQQDLEVELHSKSERIRLPVFDVSRHGMFISCKDPPPMHHAVLMTVRLRGGPFETMATVMRRVTQHSQAYIPTGTQGRGGAQPLGMGVKLFCLGQEAKERWDRYVGQLEDPGVQLPTRATPHAAACFIVQPETTAELLEFYMQNVSASRTLYVSPALRMIGAAVRFILVHPDTSEEFTLEAKVTEWNPDHPLRMGVRFERIDKDDRRRFRGFLGPVPGTGTLSMPDGAPLVSGSRPKWTEYAFFSPKVRASRDPSGEFVLLDDDAAPAIIVPPSSKELDVIEGELLDLPALELVDKRELFDFNWNAEEPSDPTKKPKR